ncbi:hypothetical protein N9J80_06315 [Flavobacteriaceae bacterium]|nr:hypothetical protein [Flavobacteriaceae bacterium]
MKFITPLILGTVFLSIFNCKSSKESTLQLHSSFPIEITAPYYNTWVAGVEGGGAGINVFLPLKENAKISIDSLHFRGEKSAVETRDKLIIGHFRYSTNPKKDIIMSSNPQDEYNNKRVLKRDTSPFSLIQNECVISYKINGKRLYYKISNLKKGESIAYPSAPPKNH